MLLKTIECDDPTGITFNSRNQRIIVSDYRNQRIRVFNNQMNHLNSFGTNGDKRGQSNCPLGVCMQPATNHIIVTEQYDHQIQLFCNDDYKMQSLYHVGDTEESQEPGNFNHPRGVACNNRGHIYVADCFNHRVQILNEKGLFIRMMGGQKGSANHQFDVPCDVCVDWNHNQILVVDYWNQRVSVWSGDGSQFVRVVSLGDYPNCLTIDHFNRLIVGFDNKISMFDTRFNMLQSFGSHGNKLGEFSRIAGLCFTDENNLMVCDRNNNRVQLFKI